MSGLRVTARRISSSPPLAVPPKSIALQIEKAAGRLATEYEHGAGGRRPIETWQQVARRLNFEQLERGHPRDIRRAIGEIWNDGSRVAEPYPLISHSVAANRKSYDRAIILAYLRMFPVEHPIFDHLAQSVALVAQRHNWPWAERGEQWCLWDREMGPETLARALLEREVPSSVLNDAGLDGDLAEGAFVADALDAACEYVGSAQGPAAEALGEKLLSVFSDLGVSDADAMLVYALLSPWVNENPSPSHRRALSALLVKRVGDPRITPAAWAVVKRDLDERMPDADFSAMIATLRKWLTSATVRAFFTIIRTTTNNPVQWAAREAFWLGYLDADLVTDAWFAFGRQAEVKAGALARQEEVRYGRVSGGCDPTHSTLIMSIGDTRIAEWSHNGKCRLWPVSSSQAPALYKREYDGNRLRVEYGPSGFQAISHAGPWQYKLARAIYGLTNVSHPKFGRGAY